MPSQQRKPVLGITAALIPALVATFWVVAGRIAPSALNGYVAMFGAAFLYVGTVLAALVGIAPSLCALLRKERFPFLPPLAIVLNAIPFLWFIH
jgi:hypothetical protein